MKRVIRDYKRTNKVRAEYFEKMLAETVEEYNTRDKLTFANTVANDTVNAVSSLVNLKIEELSGKLLELLKGVEEDKNQFKELGITFEEKAFYDILVNLRDTQVRVPGRQVQDAREEDLNQDKDDMHEDRRHAHADGSHFACRVWQT